MYRSYTEEKNVSQRRRYSKRGNSEVKKKPQSDTITFMMVDEEYMGMSLPYALSSQGVRNRVREIGCSWCQNFKIWKIPKQNFTQLRTEIPTLLPDAKIEDLPHFLDRVLKPLTEKLHIVSQNKIITYHPLDPHIDITENPLYPHLYSFQKFTLQLAVKNYGRLLIADEMGIGKSIQALACSLCYQDDWPLLIICPSSLKYVWKEQIKKWLQYQFKREQVQVIDKSGTNINLSAKIIIYSYELAVKSLDQIRNIQTVIADEAHYLKNHNAKRTESLMPFLTTRKRVFLLTGTPALAKPRQIFNLIQIVRPDIFTGLKQFADRYCTLRWNPWTHKNEYDGNRNLAQLHFLIKNRMMVRRQKLQVMDDLPSKQRQIVMIQTQKSLIKEIANLMKNNDIPTDILRNSEKLIQKGLEEQKEEISPLAKCFSLTGQAKVEAVKAYLSFVLQNDVKILIFAHHQVMIEELDQHLKKLKVQFIRIDGKTGMEERVKLVKEFQQNSFIRAAVLSITAAGVGLTLTAASTVIFAELHWTPAILLQAEDRAHRISQKSSVNVHYLVGENSLDSLLLRHLERKLQTTGNILNGVESKLDAQLLEKGVMGKLSTPMKIEPTQKKILQYMNKSKNIERKQDTPSKKEESDISEDDLIPEDQLQKMIMEKDQELRQKCRDKQTI